MGNEEPTTRANETRAGGMNGNDDGEQTDEESSKTANERTVPTSIPPRSETIKISLSLSLFV